MVWDKRVAYGERLKAAFMNFREKIKAVKVMEFGKSMELIS